MADSHQRSPIARMNPFRGRLSGRAVKIAAPLALVATLAPVGLGVAAAGGVPVQADLGGVFTADAAGTSDATRAPEVSRSVPRVSWTPAEAERLARKAATDKAVRGAHTQMWTTEDLKLWSGPGKDANPKGTVKAVTEVLVTGREANGRVEILRSREPRWVEAGKLSSYKPIVAASGLSMAPCAATGGSDLGLTRDASYTLRSLCAAFPQISTYGGWDNHGEHADGSSIDAMIAVSDTSLGYAVVDFLMAHASELKLNDIIYRQRIWQPGVGWKSMSDRGSLTANHYDHVHVRTN
ncbi:hypothetical protein [Nocardioides jejuensis]|uniref:ARB-07466-like C-terminal domain-containing protein n=1 Tax=Nocardioides jejuensis TaxID=2502782 RepID=A0A4R1CAZ4_9ACTN|nr:hypothetical protein [Nocardioides jejuensis]TCJ28030.1 hypothetical protein EPD65_08565 [Nocardioides jejuensis]